MNNQQLLEYINSNRKSIEEWGELRIYFEDSSVYHLQVSQEVLSMYRPKTMVLFKNEVISWFRDQQIKKLGI